MADDVLPAPKRRKLSPDREQIDSRASSKSAPASSTTASFASLGVKPWLTSSLSKLQITRPTQIQVEAIPAVLSGRDCIGGSKTGSGKTVAFAVPILQKWAEDPAGVFALVLTATRELALQIFEQIQAVSAGQSFKPLLITGGADMQNQAIELKKWPHVVVATPGRLADHIEMSGEDTIRGLRRVKFVVLDEADRILASGKGSMLQDLETCLSVVPPSAQRQTLLFTATVTPDVRLFTDSNLSPDKHKNLFITEVSSSSSTALPDSLMQTYILVPPNQRETYLHVLLTTPLNTLRSAIIFVNKSQTATYLEYLLRLLDHRVTALHSRLRARDRIDNLGRFRARAARILIATDVAARGLDIPTVDLVVNYDVPRDPDDYIHRVGRTARAARKGQSVTFIGQRDVLLVQTIEARVEDEMQDYDEEGVSIKGRTSKESTLKLVGDMKREAAVRIEQGRDVKGNRRHLGIRKER